MGLSAKLLVRLPASEVAMFRFLLEARENLALFTALEAKTALLKVFFAPESREQVIEALEDIKRSVSMQWTEWPVRGTSSKLAG